MYVAIHHRVTDHDRFWQVLDEQTENPGPNARIHKVLRNENGDRAVVLWEGESVDALRSHVERAVGAFSENEYEPVKSARTWGME